MPLNKGGKRGAEFFTRGGVKMEDGPPEGQRKIALKRRKKKGGNSIAGKKRARKVILGKRKGGKSHKTFFAKCLPIGRKLVHSTGKRAQIFFCG